MPNYNVQDFSYTNPKTNKTGTSTMFGSQAKHDHTQSAQFTPDAIAWLVANNHWPQVEIVPGKFFSSQGKPAAGHQLNWNGNDWV